MLVLHSYQSFCLHELLLIESEQVAGALCYLLGVGLGPPFFGASVATVHLALLFVPLFYDKLPHIIELALIDVIAECSCFGLQILYLLYMVEASLPCAHASPDLKSSALRLFL